MWLRVLVVAVSAVVLRQLFIVIESLGFHVTIYNHKPGECALIRGISNGSEDVALLSDGLALISSGMPTLLNREEGYPPGHIFAYDFEDDDHLKVTEVQLQGFDTGKLYPHGISVYEDQKTGETFLFVVNHLVGYDAIEIFEFHRKSMTLVFIRTVRDPLMKSINDVAADGPDSFYFTNDGRTLHPGLRVIDQLLRFRTGGLFYCDVTSCRQIGPGLFEPNGIEISRDKMYLFLSQPFEERLTIYKREATGGGLGEDPVVTIRLGTKPDNVFEDDVGDLWLGCHPVGIRTLEHLKDTSMISPSQVIRIKFHDSAEPYQSYDLDEVYSEEGRNISMSSVAVYHKSRLLIGTVLQGALHCKVDVI